MHRDNHNFPNNTQVTDEETVSCPYCGDVLNESIMVWDLAEGQLICPDCLEDLKRESEDEEYQQDKADEAKNEEL